MKLQDFGYNDKIEKVRSEIGLTDFIIGRIILEHKERYVVFTEKGELEAEVTGNIRFTARGREDFPAVGDWVALIEYDTDFAIINKILPRFSVISRQAVGHYGQIQIIAANVDSAFVMQAADRDFNLNRLERYLTICYASRVKPVIVLTKADLVNEQELSQIMDLVRLRIKNLPVIAVSNETRYGYELLFDHMEKGKTYCMLGSSGVGKSSLLNNLSGRMLMKTVSVSQSTNKGRHTTSHRELVVLENGGVLIDNPGMREVGIADAVSGLENTFDQIAVYSQNCRYTDCTHTSEAGCAVLEAVEKGDIIREAYENYLKLEREKMHFESSVAEKRRREKHFGKMMKNYKKTMRRDDDDRR